MKNNHYQIKNTMPSVAFWLIGAILLLPIIILPPTFQPSDWTRSMLFKIIITAITIILAFGFFYKKNLSLSLPKWKFSNYLPLIILGAFFANIIIATLFSQDMTFSIFASPTRAGGILNLLFFLAFSVILTLCINKNRWEKLFNILLITGIMSSLLAIVQYFNLFKNIFISFGGGSTPSFLGNSTILAIYMLFLSFLAFVFFIQKQTKNEKIYYGILFFLFTFTIFITGSRAGYLGLIIGLLYFFLFYPYPKKYKTLKIASASLLLFSLIIIAIFNFFPQLGEKNNTLKNISNRVSIAKVSQDVFGTRLSAWKITWRALQDKPLLGYGPENFYIGFEKYYDPTPFNTPTLLWDRPHNILLDVATSSGIPSLILYLAFWITLFWRLQITKNAQKKDDYYANSTIKIHGVQAMFVGYLIVLFFNFDSFSTYLISFFFIGYSFYLIFLQSETITITPFKNTFLQQKWLGLALLAIVLLFVWFWNIKPLYLNEKITYFRNLASVRSCKEALAISNSENWNRSGIIKSYAILKYSDTIKNCAFAEPQKELEYSKKIISLLQESSRLQPALSRTWLFLGSFTNVLAAREENKDNQKVILQEAIAYLKKSLALSPKRQEIYAEMEKSYLIAQQYSEMESIGQECIAIDPRFAECYWHLGLAQIFLGKQAEGKVNTDLALKKGYDYNVAYKQLAVAYMSQENWPEALSAYEKVGLPNETLNPSGAASYYATLAFLYNQAGNYAKAGHSALQVFRIQPENPETFPFIKLLFAKSPNEPILNSALAFIYSAPGPYEDVTKARNIYLQLMARFPKNPEYRWKFIETYYQRKDYARAYQEALIFLKLNIEKTDQIENFLMTLPKEYWEEYFKNKK